MPFTYAFVPEYIQEAVKLIAVIEMSTWSETKEFKTNEIKLFDKSLKAVIADEEKEVIAN